jgi:predicted  nucleic acid-binding Zn-ribbon protein
MRNHAHGPLIFELVFQRLQTLGQAKLAEAQAVRAEKAKLVTDPRFMLYYERLRTKRWPVVVPLTPDGVCDGCHLVQPPSVSQMVDHNAGLVACTMCGRVLYRA